MGIRLHKFAGWGLFLDGLSTQRLEDGILEDPAAQAAWLDDVMGYIDAHDAFDERMSFDLRLVRRPARTLGDMVIHAPFSGMPDRILFQAHGQETWSRHDDILDVLEYEARWPVDGPASMSPEWLDLPGNIFPYSGRMRRDPDAALGFSRWADGSSLTDPAAFKASPPFVPAHVWYLIKHLGLAESSSARHIAALHLRLRPKLFIFWQ